ncbi:MAG: hypothetical protein ACT4PV_08325 [Planctomycetaceae bacterium]
MAPQLGMGTFRIYRNNVPSLWATSDANMSSTERWAYSKNAGFVKDGDVLFCVKVGAYLDTDEKFCHFLTNVEGLNVNNLYVRSHSISAINCPGTAKRT